MWNNQGCKPWRILSEGPTTLNATRRQCSCIIVFCSTWNQRPSSRCSAEIQQQGRRVVQREVTQYGKCPRSPLCPFAIPRIPLRRNSVDFICQTSNLTDVLSTPHSQAVQAMKTYGTKLWIDDAADAAIRNSQESKDDTFDFFEEHTSLESKQPKVRNWQRNRRLSRGSWVDREDNVSFERRE